jgi:hypothetical protein
MAASCFDAAKREAEFGPKIAQHQKEPVRVIAVIVTSRSTMARRILGTDQSALRPGDVGV